MKKGFTLLEVMVVIGILAILLSFTFGMFNVGNLGWDIHNIRIRLQQEARRGMDSMVNELYQTASGQITVDEGVNVIIFKVPVIVPPDTDIYDANGNIRWGTEGDTGRSISYYRDRNTNQLIRAIINDATGVELSREVFANYLGNLRFRRQPTGAANPPISLIITLTCQKTVRPGSPDMISVDLESRVTFRN